MSQHRDPGKSVFPQAVREAIDAAYRRGVEDAAKVLTDNGYGDTRGLLLVRALSPAPGAATATKCSHALCRIGDPFCPSCGEWMRTSAPAAGGDEEAT